MWYVRKMDKDRKKTIEQSVNKIYHKADVREKAGRDPFNTGWQATLEIILLMMEKNIIEQPGELLVMQIVDQDEWDLQHYKSVKFYQNDRKATEYKQFFDETEMKIYEVMTGRPYPR